MYERAKSEEWIAETCVCHRVEEVENKIGAGLIEEVIKVAESELKLIDIMYKSKAYVYSRSHVYSLHDANIIYLAGRTWRRSLRRASGTTSSANGTIHTTCQSKENCSEVT